MRQVDDAAAFGIDLQPVAGANAARFGADQQGQAEVKGVAIKQACKRGRDHRIHAQMPQRAGGLFTRGAHAKVLSADDDIAGFHLGRKARLHGLEAVFCDLFDAKFHVNARRKHVGVEVVTEHPGLAAHDINSRGSAMRPVTADAATVYGEPR